MDMVIPWEIIRRKKIKFYCYKITNLFIKPVTTIQGQSWSTDTIDTYWETVIGT